MAFGLDEVRGWVEDPEAVDHSPDALRTAFELFQTSGGVTHFREASALENFHMLAAAARASGAFAFLVLQQFVASPWAEPGGPKVGVAFGHLRRVHPQALVAVDGRIEGNVPWMTGATFFDQVILGYVDGSEEVRARVPAASREGFRHSAPMELLAMSATQTVSVEVQLEVPAEILCRDSVGSMAERDQFSLVWQTPLMVGSMLASLDELQGRRAVVAKAEELIARLEQAVGWPPDFEEGLRLRSEAGEACVLLARLAMLERGAGSLHKGHPAGRRLREAMLYNLMARTPEIVDAAMEWETR